MLINAREHSHARITPHDNGLMLGQHPSLPLTIQDVETVARHVPVVLPRNTTSSTLPHALIPQLDRETDLLQGYVPGLLREYPFSLLQDGVTVHDDASLQLAPVLWADPKAPHWSQDGYRLFDEQGQPTSYLEGVVSRLMGLKQHVDRTHHLIALLHRAEVLTPIHVRHQDTWWPCYRIETANLSDRLESLDDPLAGNAALFAVTLADSMASLTAVDNTDDVPEARSRLWTW